MPLAEAVVFAMLASYVISRTLVPTLVMWFYRNVNLHGEQVDDSQIASLDPAIRSISSGRLSAALTVFATGYRALLASCFEHRESFAIFFLAFCVGFVAADDHCWDRNFFPTVDAGQFLLHVRAPTGTRIEETERLAEQVDSVIRKEIPAEGTGRHSRQHRHSEFLDQSELQHQRRHRAGRRGHPGFAQARPCADGRICAPAAHSV